MSAGATGSRAGAVHALGLLAAARAARETAQAIAARRAGRDASAQEPAATAAHDLRLLRHELGAHTVQLRLWAMTAPPADATARLVHGFEQRRLVADVAGRLRTAHQKLLSLYPAVAPETVEAVRRLAADAAHDAVADAPDLAALGARLADVLDSFTGLGD